MTTMTARERLNRRMRWIGGAMYAGLAVMFSGILLGVIFVGEPIQAVLLPGIGVAVVASMVGWFGGLKCPWCPGNLAPLIMQRVGMSVDSRLCYCPYCGRSLDEEVALADPAKSGRDA